MEGRKIRIRLAKIQNWNPNDPTVPLNILLYSQASEEPIAAHSVRACLIVDYLHIGASLVVDYIPDQPQIVVVVKRIDYQQKVEAKMMLGQASIDLSELMQNKIQYFPMNQIGQNLQVWALDKYVFPIPTLKPSPSNNLDRKSREKKFLKDRRNFLILNKKNQIANDRAFYHNILTLLSKRPESKLVDMLKSCQHLRSPDKLQMRSSLPGRRGGRHQPEQQARRQQ